MKKVIKSTTLCFFIFFAVVSYISAQITENTKTIVLISTNLDLRQPVIPVIDASVLNKKINPISNEIALMFKDVIDTLRITVADAIQTGLNCNVIYGEALHLSPGFKELKENYDFKDYLLTEDEYFPEIVTAKNDINPFKFEKGKIEKYFKNPDNYASTIAEICKGLNVDYVAVSQTLLLPIPGTMLKSHTLNLVTYFFLFKNDGECIGNTAGGAEYPKGVDFQPDDVNSYMEAIDQLPDALAVALQKFAKKNKNF